MSNIQELLAAITDMQRNAQQNLPVIPNNGNPAGAYNMPQAGTPATMQAAAPATVDYSKPSPSMELIYQMLNQPLQGGRSKNIFEELPQILAAKQQGTMAWPRRPVPTVPQAVQPAPAAQHILPVLPTQTSNY